MTKDDLDNKAREILDSGVKRCMRNNMILANTEDLARILGLSLQGVQRLYQRYDLYTLEVTRRTEGGYELKFQDGKLLEMKWGNK